MLFVHIYVHLQHTHLWIAFTGLAGRVFLSPAHHQIHHSNNPVHFDKNLGSCLAIWDWLFGTLYVPAKEPEPLTFGVKVGEADMHSFGELAIAPMQRAAAHVRAITAGGRRVAACTPLARFRKDARKRALAFKPAVIEEFLFLRRCVATKNRVAMREAAEATDNVAVLLGVFQVCALRLAIELTQRS